MSEETKATEPQEAPEVTPERTMEEKQRDFSAIVGCADGFAYHMAGRLMQSGLKRASIDRLIAMAMIDFQAEVAQKLGLPFTKPEPRRIITFPH